MSRGEEIATRFATLEPWEARFVVEGAPYGGDLDYSTDARVPAFFDWLGAPRTILELGSSEGALTLQLAAGESVARVVALERRADHVERARLAIALLGRGNVEVVAADPATCDLSAYGTFDAVFCAGLLHRLATPWELLERIALVTGRLFLDTHYTVSGDGVDRDRDLRGRWVEEGDADPTTGARLRSVWLTRPSILKALTSSGWVVRAVSDHPHWRGGPRIWLCCERAGSTA